MVVIRSRMSGFINRQYFPLQRFQDIEESHLRQMREFLVTYVELIQTNQDMVGQVHQDFKRQFLDMTVDKLLEQFVLNKYTGLEKPGKERGEPGDRVGKEL